MKKTTKIAIGGLASLTYLATPFAYNYFLKSRQKEPETTPTEIRILTQEEIDREIQEQLKYIQERMYVPEESKKKEIFLDEDEIINQTAKRVGVDSALLKSIRKAENGRTGLEFGIMPTENYQRDNGIIENGKFRPYINELEKQASWCAWTIKKNSQRFNSTPKGDFISYLQQNYCPVGAKNDPKNLNKNWAQNVKSLYKRFKKT